MFINLLRYVQKKERIFIGNQVAHEKETIRFQTKWVDVAKEYGLVPTPEFKEGTVALGIGVEGIMQCLRYDVEEEREIVNGLAKGRSSIINAYKLGDSNV